MSPQEMQQLAELLQNVPGIRSIDLKDVRRLAQLLREAPEIGSIEVKGWFGTGVVITRTAAAPIAPVAMPMPISLSPSMPAGEDQARLEAGAGLASAIRIYPEKDLTELDRLGILHRDLTDHTGDLGLDLVHDLHRLDDADRLAGGDPVADLDIRLGARLRGLIERADHG